MRNTSLAVQTMFPLVLLFLADGIATGAHAQPAPASQTDARTAQAREHFRRGEALIQQRQYREALGEFEVGYGLSRRPLFLFNMAECARELGDTVRARRLYSEYLAADPNGTMSATAATRRDALPPDPVRPANPPTPGSNPPPSNVIVTPPTAALTAPAEPARGPRITPSESTALDIPVPQQRDGGKSIFEDWPFWLITGVVVVGGGVAIGFAASASSPGFVCGANCVDLRN